MKNVLVFIVTVALSSSVFAIGNVISDGKGKGPAVSGAVGAAPIKAERASQGDTLMQKKQNQ